VTQQTDELNDILLGNRKKIAKFSMRTFTCGSTFLYGVTQGLGGAAMRVEGGALVGLLHKIIKRKNGK
jgi:hypothetical protein